MNDDPFLDLLDAIGGARSQTLTDAWVALGTPSSELTLSEMIAMHNSRLSGVTLPPAVDADAIAAWQTAANANNIPITFASDATITLNS